MEPRLGPMRFRARDDVFGGGFSFSSRPARARRARLPSSLVIPRAWVNPKALVLLGEVAACMRMSPRVRLLVCPKGAEEGGYQR